MSYWSRWRVCKDGGGNPNHDEKGRFSSGSGDSLGSRMITAGKAGGFTYDANGHTPTTGYSVGVFPERSGKFDVTTVTADDVDKWLAQNSAQAFNAGNMVGGWVDDGKLWLDVVHVFPSTEKEAAIAAGKEHNQIAIANLEAINKGNWDEAFINTDGNGEAVKKSVKSKPKLVLFPKKVTGQQILEKLGIKSKK